MVLSMDTLLEEQFHQSLRLDHKRAVPIPCAIKHVKSAFGELLATSPSTLILSSGQDTEQEAKMWDCFAEVYEKEVNQQECKGQELSTDKKRQILADILVWAEISQSHYDQNTVSFVTAPHCEDDSFQRIGKVFKAAKERRGL
eukprot:jgi/Chrzof1/8405/Cz03g09130.t1